VVIPVDVEQFDLGLSATPHFYRRLWPPTYTLFHWPPPMSVPWDDMSSFVDALQNQPTQRIRPFAS
jgi:hypothetical protein